MAKSVREMSTNIKYLLASESCAMYLPGMGAVLSLTIGYITKSVTYQCDVRPTVVSYPAARHHCTMAEIILHRLVTEAHV